MRSPFIVLLLASTACFCVWAGSNKLTKESVDWPTIGGGPDNLHYSTLSQINKKNVAKLQTAWTFNSGDAFPGSEMECTPIVVNGTLFATTPKLRVVALNAATGAQQWSFNPNEEGAVVTKMRNRGVAYWDSTDGDKRIFFAAREYLYGLNAETGKPISGFGTEGRINLRDDLGRSAEGLSISDTSPPMIYKDLLIVGSIVSESLPAAPGDVRAYDVRTGKLRWSFHTIPHPGEFGYETWPADGWKYLGGVNNWSGMSLDAQRGLVFLPLGSATFDFFGANRAGDNLFANCLLVLKADTGERVWHYQTVHHDLWDRDLPTAPTLVSVLREGRRVDAVAQPTKSGFVFLFDRETGKPLFPIESRGYPKSDVEGEVTAATQALPTKPAPFARQILTEDMLTQRTPEAHQAVLERFRKLRSAGQFIPPSREGTIVFPGFDGGAEWGGSAFDPDTGLLYVNANEMAWVLRLVPSNSQKQATNGQQLYLRECSGCHRPDLKGTPPDFPSLVNVGERLNDGDISKLVHQGAGRMPSFARLPENDIQAIIQYVAHGNNVEVHPTQVADSPINQKYGIDGYNKFLDPDGYPAIQPPWGTLNAINLNTGEYAWKQPFGEYPQLAQEGMKNTGSENYGGAVVTKNGLLFIAATNYDKKFHVFDKATGKLLWETELPAAGNATPAVYQANGKEYIVIACGGGKAKTKAGDSSGGTYVAFALP